MKVYNAIFSLLLLVFSGCAMRDTSNLLDLDERTLKGNSENIEKLYESWIQPVSEKGEYGFNKVKLTSTQEWYDAQNSVKDGFIRFCKLKKGISYYGDSNRGFTLTCNSDDSKLIGKLMIQRFEGNILQIEFDSSLREKERKKREERFSNLKLLNGPTGTIYTSNGRIYHFLRVGDFYESHIWYIDIGEKKPMYFYDVKEITFDTVNNEPMAKVILRNGDKFEVNETKLERQEFGYSIVGGDFFIVLLDPQTKEAYTKIYPWFDGIESISFDKKDKWEHEKTYTIKSSFRLVTKEKYGKYISDLRKEAESLYISAKKKGYLRIFSDDLFTPNYVEYAQTALMLLENDEGCSQTIDKGVFNTLTSLQCVQAKVELAGLNQYDFRKKYQLDIQQMPLTAFTILEKLEQDMSRFKSK